jgi:hypothetical protein
MNRKNSQGGSSFAYHHTLLERSPDTQTPQTKPKTNKSIVDLSFIATPQALIEKDKTAETRKGCGKYYDTWEGDIEIKCGDDLLNGHPILCPECKGEK